MYPRPHPRNSHLVSLGMVGKIAFWQESQVIFCVNELRTTLSEIRLYTLISERSYVMEQWDPQFVPGIIKQGPPLSLRLLLLMRKI